MAPTYAPQPRSPTNDNQGKKKDYRNASRRAGEFRWVPVQKNEPTSPTSDDNLNSSESDTNDEENDNNNNNNDEDDVQYIKKSSRNESESNEDNDNDEYIIIRKRERRLKNKSRTRVSRRKLSTRGINSHMWVLKTDPYIEKNFHGLTIEFPFKADTVSILKPNQELSPVNLKGKRYQDQNCSENSKNEHTSEKEKSLILRTWHSKSDNLFLDQYETRVKQMCDVLSESESNEGNSTGRKRVTFSNTCGVQTYGVPRFKKTVMR